MTFKRVALVAGLSFIGGCSGGLVIDKSLPASEAGDYTLAMSACEAVPGHGMDVCRVKEGANIDSSWTMIIPKRGGAVLGWEADLYYRDVAKAVHAEGSGPVVQVAWKEFFAQEKWTRDLAGEALALVSVRYKLPTGIEEIVRFKGLAKILVLQEGYDRMPIDSGFAAWGTNCKIRYSTAGRGAIQCK